MANRIDGLNANRGIAMDNQLKANPGATGQTGGTSAAATADTVALTAEAQSLQQLGSLGETGQAYFDRDRVDAIKASIASGEYAVDSDRVAEKFLETEALLGKI